MTTNGPRPSLINLFDPLVNSTVNLDTPLTPLRRDVVADKENANSNSPFNNSDMSIFVAKISKPSPHPQPRPLRRRLVDIGDMTLEDASCPEALLDESIEDELNACFEQTTEDDENATLTFRDMVKAATPIKKHNAAHESEAHIPSRTTRTPLANLIFAQATSTPILESNDKSQEEPSIKFITEGSAPERVCFSALEPQEAAKPVLTVRPSGAPEDIPLPSSPAISAPEFFPTVDMVTEQVDYTEEPLNCANTGRTIHSTPHGSNNIANNAWKNDNGIQIAGTEEHIRSETDAYLEPNSSESSNTSSTDISIPSNSSPPSSPMSPSFKPESKPEAAEVVSPVSLVTLRPRPPTATDDRISVDLDSSLRMHMHSGEMFDLLSDKVSFLTVQSGLDSFLTTTEDDPSFDLEAEKINMEKGLLKRDPGSQGEKLGAVFPTKTHVTEPPNQASQVDTSGYFPGPECIQMPNIPSTPSHSANDGRIAGTTHRITQKRLSIPVAISSPRLVDVSPMNKTRSMSISVSPVQNAPIGASESSPVASSGSVVPPTVVPGQKKSTHFVTPKSKDGTTPEMPAIVPAPKIIKRTRPNGHERNDSTRTEYKRSLDLVAGSKELRTVITGSLRTKKPVQIPETPERAVANPLPPASRQAARPRSIAPPRPSLSNGSGPRRVPASEGAQSKSVTALKSTTMPPPSGGPRRVLAPSGPSVPTSQPRPSVGTADMKAPALAGTVTSTATSSLPKPASRLSLTSRLPAPRTLKAGSLRRPT